MSYNEDEETFEATDHFDVDGSSLVEEVAYDSESQELLVYFRSGSGYVYNDVPANVFHDFRDSFSKGQFYNNWVKRKYGPGREVFWSWVKRKYGPGREVFWSTEVVEKPASNVTDVAKAEKFLDSRSTFSINTVRQSIGQPTSANATSATFSLTVSPVDEFTYPHEVFYEVNGVVYSTTVDAGKGVFDGINQVVERLEALGLPFEIKEVHVIVNE